ncbi:cellulose synthase (plasmid) [Rhizobium grahamii]|uniref:Cellulose synthase n=1 Tax=Rhizobium grahamii TaxID=1120045 RepID=A0A5Q0CG70_9HYPH|nr:MULTISPECIES: cellulose synthase [Rhizobium]QFY62859.1 cellulose synthase [Rhizobium grahamii]QRM52394.1 cellulose synthase [Rhizobium sp. BG6]
MRSSFIAVGVAVVVAGLVTALKDRVAIQEALGLASPGRSAPQLMLMGRITGPETPSQNPARDINLVADQIQAAASAAPSSAPPSPPVGPDPMNDVAQAAPSPTPAPVAAQAPTQTAPAAQPSNQPKVDESALRYFASRGDKARLQAEISRLQALYPNWVPPADPLAVPQSGDKQLETMWSLYSEGRYAELRKAITDRQTAEAGWQPPADLLDRLDVAEARARLVNASDLKQYATVVDIGANTPSLLTCSDIDILWRVAEAFVRTDRAQRGQDAYTYILKNCTNPQERLATVQKASSLLPYGAMQPLLALERADGNGGREFDSIRNDLARTFVAAGNGDANLAVAPEYISVVEKLAAAQGLASDNLLLGWYQVRRENYPDAEKWFRAARTKEDSASASQGLALALIAEKKPQEAEDVMFKWHDDSDDAKATYLAATANLMALQPPANLSETVLGRIATVVIAEKYVPTAQQFGWYARTLNQPQTAARWFQTALRWKADDEPSAYGLAITLEQLNDRRGVQDVQRLWAGRSERIAHLGDTSSLTPAAQALAPVPTAVQPVSQSPAYPLATQPQTTTAPASTVDVAQAPTMARPAMRTVAVQRASRTPRGCSTTIDARLLDPGSALTRGWCLMDLNRPMEAVEAFEAALASPTRKVREDAAYGQSLAYLRAGLSNNAAVAATKAPQSRQRAAELQVAILSDRALSAYGAKRYRETLVYLDQRAQLQQERIDLMVLRGYCYLNLQMYGDAERIFNAAAATGNKDGYRGLADLKAATHPDTVD